MHTLFDDVLMKKKDWICFEFGAPSDDLLPLDLIKQASMELEASHILQYGPQLGSAAFRSAIKNWSLCNKGSANVACTSGASQSLANIAHLFARPKNTIVLVENPTYFLGIRVLKEALPENEFVSVPSSPENGLDLDELEIILQKYSTSSTNTNTMEETVTDPLQMQVSTSDEASQSDFNPKTFAFLLYLVPTFSNPTSASIPDSNKKRLVDLARKFDVLVVCDDVYNLLPFPDTVTTSTSRIVDFDLATLPTAECRGGNVISNQSFSKILGPGIRLGWIECSSYLLTHFAKSPLLASGGSPNQFTSNLVAKAINNGSLTDHILSLRSIFEKRCNALCTALSEFLPPQAKWIIPKGGYFVWVTIKDLRPPLTTSLILSILNNKVPADHGVHLEKVSFAPGPAFTLEKGDFENCLRLSFAMYSESDLIEGAKRLGRVLSSCV